MVNQHIPPFVKTPFTSVFGVLMQHQKNPKCRDFELAWLECQQAYGYERAETECKDYIDDFNECLYMTKQRNRYLEMQKHREEKFKNGEIDSKVAHEPPADHFKYV